MSSFGDVQLNGNTNFRFTGSMNVGTCTFNANLFLHAVASSLNIAHNRNCKFDIEQTELKATKNFNTKIDGKKNDFTLNDNKNLQIHGDLNHLFFEDNKNTKLRGTQNDGKFKSNKNLEYFGDNGKTSFSDNKNAKLHGNYNDVTAEKNKNLKVEGDNHHLDISGTKNHVMKTVPPPSTENVVRIVPDTYRISNWRSWLENRDPENDISVTYFIDYVNKAVIHDEEYNLGIFKFNMARSGNQIQLSFDNSALDAGTFQVMSSSSDKYTISATKNGNKETLSVIGPAVSAGNANVVIVNLIKASKWLL